MNENLLQRALTSALILTTGASTTLRAQSASQLAAQPYGGVVGRTLAESKEWWPEPVKAPKGAPNVVWILIDDVGYGACETFGGLIRTPTFDALANNGLRYGRDLFQHRQLRIGLQAFVLSSLLASGIAGFLGAMLDKAAPVEGGKTIHLVSGDQK